MLNVRAARSACILVGVVDGSTPEGSMISRCAVTGSSSHGPGPSSGDEAQGPGLSSAGDPAQRARAMSLQIESLHKHFGSVVALDGLTFDVSSGEIFGFLGANGAGKTTTMRIALGVLAADAGQIIWNGTDTRGLPRRTWGYLPEERGLYARMVVLDQLAIFWSLHGMPRDVARAAALEWLRRLRVPDLAERRAEELSKGNQQTHQLMSDVSHRHPL